MSIHSTMKSLCREHSWRYADLRKLYYMSPLLNEIIEELNDVKKRHKHDVQAYKGIIEAAIEAMNNGSSRAEVLTILESYSA